MSLKDKWSRIVELQDQLHPNWRSNKMPRSIYTTGLASEVGGICDVVVHMDGGGSRPFDREMWNNEKLLNDVVDSFVMLVLIAEKSGFNEFDFEVEWLRVEKELMERIRERQRMIREKREAGQ